VPTRPNFTDVTEACQLCGTDDNDTLLKNGNLIGCDKCDQWFHPGKCLGMITIPKGDWVCASCVGDVMKQLKQPQPASRPQPASEQDHALPQVINQVEPAKLNQVEASLVSLTSLVQGMQETMNKDKAERVQAQAAQLAQQHQLLVQPPLQPTYGVETCNNGNDMREVKDLLTQLLTVQKQQVSSPHSHQASALPAPLVPPPPPIMAPPQAQAMGGIQMMQPVNGLAAPHSTQQIQSRAMWAAAQAYYQSVNAATNQANLHNPWGPP
jgi:hypothetical protein